MVLAVLSSRMSAGGCSLAGRRDNVPCLAITAIRAKAEESTPLAYTGLLVDLDCNFDVSNVDSLEFCFSKKTKSTWEVHDKQQFIGPIGPRAKRPAA